MQAYVTLKSPMVTCCFYKVEVTGSNHLTYARAVFFFFLVAQILKKIQWFKIMKKL